MMNSCFRDIIAGLGMPKKAVSICNRGFKFSMVKIQIVTQEKGYFWTALTGNVCKAFQEVDT